MAEATPPERIWIHAEFDGVGFAPGLSELYDQRIHQDDVEYVRVDSQAVGEGQQPIEALAGDVLAVCKQRGWSLHWTHRGAYLHLESSELIEAVRGKRGDVLGEAGDVLLVLMSITENAGISFGQVVEQTRATVDSLKTKPHYAGEEFAPPKETT